MPEQHIEFNYELLITAPVHLVGTMASPEREVTVLILTRQLSSEMLLQFRVSDPDLVIFWRCQLVSRELKAALGIRLHTASSKIHASQKNKQ